MSSDKAPAFFERIVRDVLEDDCLLVMGEGLGIEKVVAGLLAEYAQGRDSSAASGDDATPAPHQSGPVILLGFQEWQRAMLAAEVRRCWPGLEQPEMVSPEIDSSKRAELYSSNSSIHVTGRIFNVDLLRKAVDPSRIRALLVMNAHRASETTGDGFAVRLCRDHPGFRGSVVGLSDSPSAMTGSFSGLERALRALYTRSVHIWPRFRDEVKEALAERAPDVVELFADLTPPMKLMQGAIAEITDRCVKQLARCDKLDPTELRNADGTAREADRIVRRQLEPIWFTVPRAVKQMANDLRTLRDLSADVLKYDCVSFLQLLDNLRQTEKVESVWLTDPCAQLLIDQAKARVYTIEGGRQHAPPEPDAAPPARGGRGRGGARGRGRGRGRAEGASGARPAAGAGTTTSVDVGSVEPVLEEQPKWRWVRDILREVQEERKKLMFAGKGSEAEGGSAQPEESTRAGSAGHGGQGKKRRVEVVLDVTSSDEEDVEAGGGASEPERARGVRPNVVVAASDKHMCEQLRRAITADGAKAMLKESFERYLEAATRGAKSRWGGWGRQRGRGGRGRGRGADPREKLLAADAPGEREALIASARKIIRKGKRGRKAPTAAAATARGGKRKRNEAADAGNDAASPEDPSGGLLDAVTFWPIDSRDTSAVLDAKPWFVVIVDPATPGTLPLLRQLELFRASRPGRPLRVYMLYYEETAKECERFLSASARETKAFVSLIQSRGHMLAPVDAQKRQVVLRQRNAADAYHPDALVEVMAAQGGNNAVTRRAGGRDLLAGPSRPGRKVVVDIREFVSNLPGVLHQEGFVVEPVTLEVGDYVLSPEMCVERKALPDLVSSLDSGRLHAQATAMCRHYKFPILLIEFDESKHFALLSPDELSPEIKPNAITSKLSLLLLHFPRLRIIWSRSMRHTCEVFEALKTNQDEPDVLAAAAVGAADDDFAGATVGSAVNDPALDVLKKLPGVTDLNWRFLARDFASLADIAAASEERLAASLKNDQSAKALHTFLHTKCPSYWS
ncbi:unnamed protein product [Pedinophyceae sp. YPF-701]|nr:unnamed protein product [Pedinophyceae sp. YPF-701]